MELETVFEDAAGVLDGLTELVPALCIQENVPVLSIHFTVRSKLIYNMTSSISRPSHLSKTSNTPPSYQIVLARLRSEINQN